VADRDLNHTPILVLGGGPAGCAAAMTLRRYLPHLEVRLLAREAPGTPAVGETLSPGVPALLAYLGLEAQFRQLGHLPCGATASAWGASGVQERSYLFSGRGQGWHLDRGRFDRWLLDCAQQSGVHCIRGRAVQASRVHGAWRIDMDGLPSVHADVVIEASGRAGWLLRRERVLPARHDALVAEARWFARPPEPARFDGALVESAPDGWWYSASLPDGRGVAMFMTDRDLRAHASWDQRLAAAPATSQRIGAWRADGPALVRPAHSQAAATVTGSDWVAAGDAAAAFDPLASMGIGFSLRSGMEAAQVAVAMLEGDGNPGGEYAASIARIYADYRVRLDAIYAMERRWPQQDFWARRHAACAAMAHAHA
jgi:flavin-dependent dehydrogenase